MGMILRIASSRIVGQGDIVGRSGYFSLNLSANSVMRGRLDARRTLKSLVADLRYNYNGWGTISAVDCNQMEGLAEAVRSVILSNQNSLKNVDTADLQQYGKGSSSFKGYAYDMLQFIGKLCGGMAPDDFTQQLKKTVVYTGYTHDPTSSLYRIDGDNYSGMGMYIPNSFTTPKYLLWNNYFKSSIAWYHASGWAETESIWGN